MKKLLVGIAALSIGATANADVKFSGDTMLRYTNISNADGVKDSNSEGFKMWNNLMVDGNKGENLGYHLQLRHVDAFGASLNVQPSAVDSATNAQENDLMYVQEANATVKIGENGALMFGRSGLELNNGELVSKQPFQDTQVAFDGIRYVHDADWGRLGFAYSVAGDTGSATSKFRALSYTFKNMPSAISNLELHYVANNADSALAATTGTERTWIGLNAGGEAGMFDYALDIENFTGKTQAGADMKAMMMHLELGLRFAAMDSRAYLVYHNDGATSDSSYDPLYYAKHKYSGRSDVLQWGNLNEIALGYTLKPMADSVAGVSYHMFKASSKDQNVTTQAGTSITTSSEDALGSEIDLWYTQNYTSGLYLTAELTMFSPGDAFGTNDESIQRLMVETGFDF
ncbi:MAG: alginate export family protein [Bdellovibrionota bacterium]|nr:alginate export family protein [Bdellovibrionota bacterium]